MKKNLQLLAMGYFGIGSLLALPMSLSYVYTQWFVLIEMGLSVFSLSGLGFIMMTGYLITIAPVIRAIFWLPSLIMWNVDPSGYSFLMWLAPGFFVE